MSEFDDQLDGEFAICPYCKNGADVEAEDFSENERVEDCRKCGKKYWLCQSLAIHHNTMPDCELNNLRHDYQDVELETSNGTRWPFCTVCGKCKEANI